jgi:nucleoid DNA-binding protein
MSTKDLREYVKNTIVHADGSKVTRLESEILVNIVLDGIQKQITETGKATIKNFGTFYVKEVKARKARNPKTGESVFVPNKNVIRFKPAAKLKGMV